MKVNKRWWPSVVAALLCVFMVGLHLGGTARAEAPVEPGVGCGPTDAYLIAVVNMDEGVNIDGRHWNYSDALIATLDDRFQVVTAAMADAGIDTGIYAGVVTFPPGTSYRIATFDALHPERVRLSFGVNRTLSEACFVETYGDLLQLQTALNTVIGHSYVHSILSGVHQGQDHLTAAHAYTIASLAALGYLEIDAFTAQIMLDALPDNPLDLIEIEVRHRLETVRSTVDRISFLYNRSYEQAVWDLEEIRNAQTGSMTTLRTQRGSWEGALDNWSDAIGPQIGAVNTFLSEAPPLRDMLEEWHSDLGIARGQLISERYKLEGFRGLQDVYGVYDGLIGWLNYTNAQIGGWQTWVNGASIWVDVTAEAWYSEAQGFFVEAGNVHSELNNWYDSLRAAQQAVVNVSADLDDLQAYMADVLNPTFNLAELLAMFDLVRDFDQSAPVVLMPELSPPPGPPNALPSTTIRKLPPLDTAGVPDMPDRLPFSLPALPTAIADAPALPPMFWPAFDAVFDHFDDFRPSDELPEYPRNQVANRIDDLEQIMFDVETDAAAQFQTNVLSLEEVRRRYTDHLTGIRQEVLGAESDAIGDLRDRVTGFHDTVTGNTEATQALFTGFAGLLPYSRTPEGVNTALVDFTIAPIDLAGPTPRTPLARADLALGSIVWLWAALALLALTLLAGTVTTIASRSNTKPTATDGPATETTGAGQTRSRRFKE